MTCNNDPETLGKVLNWGEEESRIAIRWDDQIEDPRLDKSTGTKREIKDENPILLSAQQGYTQCTRLLHQHGFRIPQIRRGAVLEGQKEGMKDPGDDNHVADDDDMKMKSDNNKMLITELPNS